MKLPVPQLLAQIKAAHLRAVEHSRSAVVAVLECGRLLKSLKLQLGDGETWVAKVEEIGMNKRTADRYIAVARFAASNPAKTKYLLEQGATLVELYRAFDLVKPVKGGDYDPGTYQKRRNDEQLVLNFSYEEAVPHLDSLIKAKNVEELSESTRRRIAEKLKKALERVQSTFDDDAAIDLENHQP